MARWANDDVMDAALAEVATATRLGACTDQPGNFAGIAAVLLADVTVTAGAGNGDYTIGNGDVSGRKLTVAQQADAAIDESGEADHVTLDDGSDLQYVTVCTPQALTDGGTVTFPAWDIEIADPTAPA